MATIGIFINYRKLINEQRMNLHGLRVSIEKEMEEILSSEFKIEITETTTVPLLDDRGITFPNLKTGIQKWKFIETCSLYIDLRKSKGLNLSHRRDTMSKLYSSFVRSIFAIVELIFYILNYLKFLLELTCPPFVAQEKAVRMTADNSYWDKCL